MSWIDEVRTGVKNLDLSSKSIRHFSLLISAVAVVAAILMVWKGSVKTNSFYLIGFAIIFAIVGSLLPAIIRPIYKVWMGFAFSLGWIMTRILLSLIFYIIITPIGLILRLMGKDFLNIRAHKQVDSYWIKRSEQKTDAEQYKHLF